MEALRDLRSTWPVVVLKSVLVGTFFLSVYNLLSFTASTDTAVDRSLSEEAEVDMYSVADTLVDPDEFWAFRQSPDSVASLAAFYDALQASTTLRHLSVFDQPVPVVDFQGDERFYLAATEGGRGPGADVRLVRSLQMNRETFEFYRLAVSSGTPPAWDDVDYLSRRLPVLLGSGYEGTYQVGDLLEADLYAEQLTLEVVGFLEPASSMFYQGELNVFLDDYLLLPYPPTLGDLDDDHTFSGILTFAMLNGDLAVPTGVPTDDVLADLREISLATGFTDYALLGVPTYLVQLALVRQVVQDNLALVVSTQIMLAVTVVGAALVISTYLSRRRRRRDLVRWTLGRSPDELARTLAASWGVEAALTLTVFAVGLSVLPNRSEVVLTALLLLVVSLVLDGLHQQLLLHRLLAGPTRKDAWHA